LKVLGIIAEYNPFHNGHLYHLRESKIKTGADYVVCVMSGNFIQRGQPALLDKWARAEMALASGVDIVIELPVVYAMSTAEYFATASVKLLDACGVVDYISFGSESGHMGTLNTIAEVLINEDERFSKLIKGSLKKGISFPAARQEALTAYLSNKTNDTMIKAIESPNNILGIEYLKALMRINSKIKPYTVSRVESQYNSDVMTESFSSATAIRKRISTVLSESSTIPVLNTDTNLINNLPVNSIEILQKYFTQARGPVNEKLYEDLIMYKLRSMTLEELRQLPYVVEGLEHRIQRAANISASLDELIINIKTKRYSQTSIQRILFLSLLNFTKDELSMFNQHGYAQYLRILGFSQKGKELLPHIKRLASLPLITKTTQIKKSCNPLLTRMFDIENLSTDTYALGYKSPSYRLAGQEFTNKILTKG